MSGRSQRAAPRESPTGPLEHATQTVHLLLEVDDLLDFVVNELSLSCHQLLTVCSRLVKEP